MYMQRKNNVSRLNLNFRPAVEGHYPYVAHTHSRCICKWHQHNTKNVIRPHEMENTTDCLSQKSALHVNHFLVESYIFDRLMYEYTHMHTLLMIDRLGCSSEMFSSCQQAHHVHHYHVLCFVHSFAFVAHHCFGLSAIFFYLSYSHFDDDDVCVYDIRVCYCLCCYSLQPLLPSLLLLLLVVCVSHNNNQKKRAANECSNKHEASTKTCTNTSHIR